VAGRHPRLTRSLIDAIALRLKGGAYERTAVEASGIAWEDYQHWLHTGACSRKRTLCRELLEKTLHAKATARLKAEIDLWKANGKAWLLHGPGRETPSSPGWSSAGRPALDLTVGGQAKLDAAIAIILDCLAQYPDARQRAIQRLRLLFGKDWIPQPPSAHLQEYPNEPDSH
jgi:hypothetical protein